MSKLPNVLPIVATQTSQISGEVIKECSNKMVCVAMVLKTISELPGSREALTKALANIIMS